MPQNFHALTLMDELKRDCLQNKCSHITKLLDVIENGSRSQDLPNKSISNSESVRSTSLKSTVDHDVLYEEFEAFMKSQRDLNNKLKVKGVHYLGEDLEQKC